MRPLAFIACLTILGVTGCASGPQATTARTPGRRMTEEQVLASATALLPQTGDTYHVNFKDGVWEVLCLSNRPARNGRTVTVRDADGKAVLEDQYLNMER